MSSGGLSQPGAAPPNEDWLSHRLNFLPLPLVITNLLPRISKRISFDASRTSSLIAPEQLHCPPTQPSKQQAERCITPTNIVDTPTEIRQPRCFSLPGPDVLNERLKNLKWSRTSLPSLRDKLSQNNASQSSSLGSFQSVSTATSVIRKPIEPRPPRFLGRYPPPIQQRSTSLPRIVERRRSQPFMPERQLLLGGPYNRTRPGYQKIPRFVPTEICRDTTFDMSSPSASDIDGHTKCCHGVMTRVFCKQCLGSTIGEEEMDSRRATRATSETLPLREKLPIAIPGEQDAGNKPVRKKIRSRSYHFCQYIWRWLRKHRDDDGCGRALDSAVASQTAGSVSTGPAETNTC